MNARQIFLLEFLLKQNEYLSANQLSEKYGVSTKTVYQDIDKINYFLEEGALNSRIIKVPRKGIKLSADEEGFMLFFWRINLNLGQKIIHQSIEN